MSTLGDYRILREIGRGSMAIVYLAEGKDGCQYALKTFTISDTATQQEWDLLRDLLINEGSVALDHPNIVKVLEVDKGDPPFIVMEYVEGSNLDTYLRTQPPLDPDHAISLLRQAASALDCAAANGLVHRDVKPANMIVSPSGTDLKLVDFGIAKGLSEWASTSSLGGGKSLSERFRVGTLRYMSPEQITEPRKVTAKADQYALANIAYLMLTGRHVFPNHENEHSLSYAIVKEKPPSPSSVNHNLSRKADKVIRRALAKNPAERYANCVEFIGDLARAVLEPGPHRLLPSWLPVAAAVTFCAVGLAAGIHYIFGPAPPPARLSDLTLKACPDGSPMTAAGCPPHQDNNQSECPDGIRKVNGECPPSVKNCPDGSAPVRGECSSIVHCPGGAVAVSGACPPPPPPPPPPPKTRYAIQVLANGKRLPDHASFPESDETFGLLARGDLAAAITAQGIVPPGAHVRVEWEFNGIIYSRRDVQASDFKDHSLTDVYRNIPGPGFYRIILKVDDKPRTEFNFQITADKSED